MKAYLAVIRGLIPFLTAAGLAAADPVVRVLNGSYEGLHLPSYQQDIFLGMPYAQDTGKANRFRVPQALNTTWDGVRAAKGYGPACPDPQPAVDGQFGMGEDCLSINIVRPSGLLARGEKKLPVMLWIHGGSYQVGTSALPNYNLTFIVRRATELGLPVLAASINYRKGGWGNMYSREIQGSGNTNLAIRDMRKALAWIQENIGAFGGNASSVTIWGESAGSFAVGQLLMSYGGRTDGLFHRSIQESGSAATAWYNGSDWYQPIYDKIVNQVNCTDAIDTLECLRTIEYEALYPFLNNSVITGPGWYPTVDGDVIPAYPTLLLRTGRFAQIPHLYGTNSDEGTDNAPVGAINTDADLYAYLLRDSGFGFPPATVARVMELYPDDPAQGIPLDTGAERFADKGYQYKRVAAIVGDVFYHATRLDDARHYAAAGAPTFVYRFNTRPLASYANTAFNNNSSSSSTEGAGSGNGGGGGGGGNATVMLAPAYKGVAHFSEVGFVFANPRSVGPWPEYRALSDQMSEQWIRFAHTGDPNGGGLPRWPRYNEGEKGLNMVLQTEAQGGSYVEEDTYRLAGREYLIEWARRRHV
ncbi:alpha/beta-hydrolase [Xylariaceae sp. FL1651]|nr:alpha/beta-hydrolase [Xylariaceae sp. FL1651]